MKSRSPRLDGGPDRRPRSGRIRSHSESFNSCRRIASVDHTHAIQAIFYPGGHELRTQVIDFIAANSGNWSGDQGQPLVVEYENAEGERRSCESSRHDTPIDVILSSAIGHSEKGDAIQFREAVLWVEGTAKA